MREKLCLKPDPNRQPRGLSRGEGHAMKGGKQKRGRGTDLPVLFSRRGRPRGRNYSRSGKKIVFEEKRRPGGPTRQQKKKKGLPEEKENRRKGTKDPHERGSRGNRGNKALKRLTLYQERGH